MDPFSFKVSNEHGSTCFRHSLGQEGNESDTKERERDVKFPYLTFTLRSLSNTVLVEGVLNSSHIISSSVGDMVYDCNSSPRGQFVRKNSTPTERTSLLRKSPTHLETPRRRIIKEDK